MLLNAGDQSVDVPRLDRSAELLKGVLQIVQFVLQGVDVQILLAYLSM